MTLRTLVFWPHLVCGLVAAAVIVVMSVTGVLLTYERQMIAWSDRHVRSSPPAAGAERLPVEAMLERLDREHPELEGTSITLAAAADAPVALAVPQRTVYLDAYSGRIIGEGSETVRRAMSALRSWHRWLAAEGDARGPARAVTGWSNLIFLFIVASGAYLWLPRKWSWPHLRPVVLFARARGKARDFNWHNVIGVWSAAPLFIVVLTAVPISFPWANALVYRAVGEEPPAGRGGGGGRGAGVAAPGRGRASAVNPVSSAATPHASVTDATAAVDSRFEGLDALWARAAAHEPRWRTISLRLPASSREPAVFSIDRGDGGQPHLRSTLTLARLDGSVVSHETFSDQTLGRRLRTIARFAHTGEVLGLPGQTIAGIVTGGSLVLVWTGVALTIRRFRAWMGRRRRLSDLDGERREPAA